MVIIKHIIFFFFFGWSINSAEAQQKALKSITTDDLHRHLSFIASDSLQGRGTGAPASGLEKAADYIAKNAGKTGLKPPKDNYFQQFGIIRSKPVQENTFLSVTNRNGAVIFTTDSLISINRSQPEQKINGSLIFAGFGWHNKTSGYDDFCNINLHEKVVLFSVGKPETYNENPRWSTHIENKKIKRAAEKGAKAIILVTSPLDKGNETWNRIKRWMQRNSFVLESGAAFEQIPVILIPPGVADALSGDRLNYGQYLSSIARKMKPNTFPVENLEVAGNAERTTDSLQAKNVIGIIEGSHPQLKDECVVLMAHYDHLGTNDKGQVYNGADDNGSGTVTLLEVAEAFAELPERPKRSIVFLWVSAEEVGLLGSDYYTQHPVFPLEKTISAINLDMVGRVYEPRDSVWKNSAKLVKDRNGVYTLVSSFFPPLESVTDSLCAELELVPDKSLPERFFHSSDHHHFHSKGVPILNMATGYHADYHKVSDVVSRINFRKMQRVAQLTFLIGYELGNRQFTKSLPLNKTETDE